MTEQPRSDQHQDDPPGPGSVEEEAHRLVRAAADWWQDRQEQAQGQQRAGTDPTRAAGHADREPVCTGCPWCRARAAWGPTGADALLGLADLLGSAADSLRGYALSQGAGGPQEGAGRPGDGAAGRPEQEASDERGPQPGGQS